MHWTLSVSLSKVIARISEVSLRLAERRDEREVSWVPYRFVSSSSSTGINKMSRLFKFLQSLKTVMNHLNKVELSRQKTA